LSQMLRSLIWVSLSYLTKRFQPMPWFEEARSAKAVSHHPRLFLPLAQPQVELADPV
jgi:hypothetical protein